MGSIICPHIKLEFLMKYFLILGLLFSVSFSNAHAVQSDVEDAIAEIEKPNANIISAARQLELDSKNLSAGNDSKKSREYILKFLESNKCLMAFTPAIADKKYKKMMEALRKISFAAAESLAKDDQKVILEQIKKEAEEIMNKQPLSLCRFKLVEDDQLKTDLAAKEKAYSKYKMLIESKKTAHPTFVKIIEGLEAQKKSLELGMSSDGIPFIAGDYEYNFVLMYELHLKFENDMIALTAKELAAKNNMTPSQLYEKKCRGQLKYDSVPEENLRYLICADDNVAKDKNNKK